MQPDHELCKAEARVSVALFDHASLPRIQRPAVKTEWTP